MPDTSKRAWSLGRWFEGSLGRRWLALILLALLIAVRIWDPPPVATLRERTFDAYQALKPREITPQPVAIVDLDEESLAEIGQWPWPRTTIAQLLDRLKAYGAVAVAFDVVFAEPDRTSPERIAERLEDVDAEIRAALQALPGNDEVLAEAIRANRVVLGQGGLPRARAEQPPPKAASVVRIGADPMPFLVEFPGMTRNLPILEDSAAGHGVFSLNPESDGIVRRVLALMRVGDAVMPTLSLELLRVATGQTSYAVKTNEAGISSVVIAGVELPTDEQGRLWIYFSRHDPAKYVSARDVLAGRAPRESLEGKLVFVGTSATGLLDIKATPVERTLPGVEVHAQLLETILSKSYLVRPNYARGAELMMTFGVGLAMVLLVPLLGALWTAISGAAIAASLAGLSWYFYLQQGVLVDVAYALVASALVFGLLVFQGYFREESERHKVRGAFGQYLSPALVEQLAQHPERLVLGGETKELTFLFCDVRGFTTISEQYKGDPQGLTRLMNRFLTPLTDRILAHDGTIDKYMGDATMAFWNAPLDVADHPVKACAAALEMLAELDALNLKLAAEAKAAGRGFLELKVGIGINTGESLVGNMGSDQHFNYSVLGDAVNLASRLEGQTKTYRVPVLVGSATRERAGDSLVFLEVDLIRVKGKSEPDRIFALLGDGALAARQEVGALVAAQARLLAAYRAQDWQAAEVALAACRQLDPGLGLAGLYDLYAARIAEFQGTPPPPDWDGVFEATSK